MILATLCYIRDGNKTLMLHRVKKENDIHEGKYNGLGGKFEEGETPEECVIREIEEESGLNIENPTLKGLLTFPGFSNDEDWFVFVYTANTFTGKMIESNEGNLEWVDTDKLKDLPLWEGDYIFLDWLDKPEFFSGKFTYVDGKLKQHSVIFY